MRGIILLTRCDHGARKFLPLDFTCLLPQPVVWPVLGEVQLIRSIALKVIWVP